MALGFWNTWVTCTLWDPDLGGVCGGPLPAPGNPKDSPGHWVCRRGHSLPGLTVRVELGALGVGGACKLTRALLGGHALPLGILVKSLGTDTAGLTLGGHLQGGGSAALGRVALSAVTQPQALLLALCVHPALAC